MTKFPIVGLKPLVLLVAIAMAGLFALNGGPAHAAESCNLGVDGLRCVGLTPDFDTNPVGTDHTVTAEVTLDGGAFPISKQLNIHVISGPNAGTAGICAPNANCSTDLATSQTTFTYTGDGGVGVDTIEVCAPFDAPDVLLCAQVEKEWVVEPPPAGGEGCTPGYWKQKHHFDSWVNYNPADDYETVFGVNASFDLNLLGALKQGGGKEKALGRHAVAALLNANNSGVSYAFTEAEVIQLVQDAYASGDFNGTKDRLEAENEAGCPLN